MRGHLASALLLESSELTSKKKKKKKSACAAGHLHGEVTPRHQYECWLSLALQSKGSLMLLIWSINGTEKVGKFHSEHERKT